MRLVLLVVLCLTDPPVVRQNNYQNCTVHLQQQLLLHVATASESPAFRGVDVHLAIAAAAAAAAAVMKLGMIFQLHTDLSTVLVMNMLDPIWGAASFPMLRA